MNEITNKPLKIEIQNNINKYLPNSAEIEVGWSFSYNSVPMIKFNFLSDGFISAFFYTKEDLKEFLIKCAMLLDAGSHPDDYFAYFLQKGFNIPETQALQEFKQAANALGQRTESEKNIGKTK